MDEETVKYSVLQPEDVRRILNITDDAEYELVVRSWRFLFDFLYSAKDGTQVISNLVQWTKCGNLGVLVTSNDYRQMELEFAPEIGLDNLFEEIMGVVEDSGIVKLPTL
jgi:hypothetical protein